MSDALEDRILSHVKSDRYRPRQPRHLARELELHGDEHYSSFRDALRELMHQGRVVLGAGGNVVVPSGHTARDEITGTYQQKKAGFGFVTPTDPTSHEDLYIPRGDNGGAMTGDVVRARITNRRPGAGGGMLFEGRITEVVERTNKRFVGSLAKQHGQWVVLPDGNTLTQPILTPDAASRHIKQGTKVVVELTTFPEKGQSPQGVITDVLGEAGEKDVDLKSVIIGFNLPGEFLEAVKNQARHAVDTFDPNSERAHRFDLSDEVICTIDPDDAKDYDDAISLRRLDGGRVELGVHIADVAHFVPRESALDLEARKRGNSTYFPGHVIPMLPEVLSNGVCSLQEGVPRLCKSVFITYDADAKPVGTKFANTIITSRQRLRYKEAQDIIDSAPAVYHPDGARAIKDYPEEVIELLGEMNALAKRLQKRRRQQGQVVLNLPEVELVLDEEGKVVGTRQEDTSFTHTLIEMFMVEANEAVARLLESVDVPFLRRVHPGPQTDDNERLRHFIQVAGYKLPKVMDRKAIQGILEQVKGKPEEFAINLAILKSLTRAEYSPEPVGHYALASDAYSHYTSPIRRYADLTIHRLLDSYLRAREAAHAEDDGAGTIRRKGRGGRKGMIDPEDIIDYDDLVTLGKQISFTERRSEDAERELRQVKILELLSGRIGELFEGVVTGITNFGIFIQIREYLVDGLIRYEDLMDDWWDVDERSGVIRGQRTGTRIGIGDVCKVIVVRVDVPRRELDLSVREVLGRSGGPGQQLPPPGKAPKKPTTRKKHQEKSHAKRGGEVRGRRGAGGGAKRRGGR